MGNVWVAVDWVARVGTAMLFIKAGHWGAAMIIRFLGPTAFLMHNYWRETDPMLRGNQESPFWKNITIAFALLLYIVQGHVHR